MPIINFFEGWASLYFILLNGLILVAHVLISKKFLLVPQKNQKTAIAIAAFFEIISLSLRLIICVMLCFLFFRISVVIPAILICFSFVLAIQLEKYQTYMGEGSIVDDFDSIKLLIRVNRTIKFFILPLTFTYIAYWVVVYCF